MKGKWLLFLQDVKGCLEEIRDKSLYIFTLFIQISKKQKENIIKRKKVIRVSEELVRTQYVIMKILRTKKATNHMKSMTLKEIAKDEKKNKINTLYKHIRILEKRNLVKSGAKAERANGYYLSEEGLNLLKKYDDMEDV